MTPEYFHAITAHLLTLGVALGLLATALACGLRSRRACMVGVALLGLCAAMAYPSSRSGHAAYRNVRVLADEQGQAWLDLHLDRAEQILPGFYALALVAGLAFEALRRQHRLGRPLLAGTALLAVGMLAAGGWVAQAGGRGRHPEFRPATPLPISDEIDYEVE